MPLQPAHADCQQQRAHSQHSSGCKTCYAQAAHNDAAAVAEVEYVGCDPAAVGQLVHVAARAGVTMIMTGGTGAGGEERRAWGAAHELLSWLPPMKTVRQGGTLVPRKYWENVPICLYLRAVRTAAPLHVGAHFTCQGTPCC